MCIDGFLIPAGGALGGATGLVGLLTMYGCLMAAGGGCAVCASLCLGAGATPTI